MEISYFEMSYDDISDMAEMERRYFSQPWKEVSIGHYMDQGNTLFLAAKDNGKLVGYCALMKIVDEADLVSIAVDEDYREMGIARELLDIGYEMLANDGIGKVHLEVRAHNEPAINLYESEGFVRDGLRKNYYSAPDEDALLYSKCLIKELEC